MSTAVQAQNVFTGCTNDVPRDTFDFSTNPTATYISSGSVRTGSCCPNRPGDDDDCVHFSLILGPTTAGVSLAIIQGAVPQGSLFASIDCDTVQNINAPICVENPLGITDTFNLTFCKPGNNLNVYSVTAVPRPTFPDVSVQLGCSDTIRVLGLNQSQAITWTSVSPGSLGQYNSLLSCTNCMQPVFTPTATSPSVVRYRVCGQAQASNCVGTQQFCDTVDITVLPRWSTVSDVTVCEPTTTASLGNAPAFAAWSFVSGPATPTINSGSGAITNMTANGTYVFVLRRTNGTGICTDTVNVIRAAKPNAGTDQSICAPTTTASLGSPGANTWSFVGGPVVATVVAGTGAVSGMTAVGDYFFQLGSGTCTDTVMVTIKAQPASPTAGNNGPLCVGQTLNLTASTVVGATYSWSGPSGFSTTTQNPSIANVTVANAGTYSVSAIINACPSVPGTTTVVVNTIPSAPSVSSNSPVCEDDTIKLFATGSGGASFTWTGPAFNSTTEDPIRLNATQAMAGSYCATQTVSGCTSAQACTNVVVNPKPTITSVLGTNPTTCGGTNGSIAICGLVSGNSYNINYSKNGAPQTPVLNQIANAGGCVFITGLSAGTYTIFTVTLGSCTSDVFGGPDVVLSDPSTPATPGISSNSPVCEGDTLKLFATGAVGATYSWTGPGGFTSNQQNPVRPNATLAMDDAAYFVTQTVNNCTSNPASISVTINPKPVISSAVGANPSSCGGTNGTITLSGLANNTLYNVSYIRNGTPFGPTSILSNGSGQVVITGLNAGTYTNFVVEVDATGCTSNAFGGPVTLTDPTTPAAPVVSSNTPVCEGDIITLFATGAVGATYSWNGPAGFNSTDEDPTRGPALLTYAGSYCVTQTVAGCTSNQACTSVVINPKPVIGSVSTSAITTCGGTDGCIFLNGLTPSASYSVTYYRNGILQGPFVLVANGSGVVSICGLNAGTYNFFNVTLNGCVSGDFNASTTLTDPTNPAAPTVSSNTPVCVGNTITLDATGVNGATFAWTGPSGFTSNQEDPTRPNATLAFAGNYCVTQTVNNCTSQQACTPVVVSALPTVSAGPDVEVCDGSCVQIGGSPTATGGTPGYTYAWSGGAVAAANPTVCPTTSTVYTVTVTDTRSCSASASVLVTVNDRPTADAGSDQNLVSCDLTGVAIGGAPTATGGTGPYTYQWFPTAGLSDPTDDNPIVSAIGSDQTYTVVVTDDNGCTASDNVFVNVIAGTYNVVIIPNTSVSWCAETGGNITLTALVVDGTPPYTYTWTGSNFIDSLGSGVTANPSTPGSYIYSVVVTDQTGCQAGDTIEITVFPTPVADAGVSDSVCNGSFVTLGGSPTASGGTAPHTYLWSGGAGSSANPSVQVTSSTTYQVTVTDANGCTAGDNVAIVVRPNPTADAGADEVLSSCSPTGIVIGGSPAASGGTAPYTYSWSPATGLSSTTVANPTLTGAGGTYTLVVTDVYGCSGSDQVFIDLINNSPGVSISASGATSWCANSGTTINLTANVSGGTSPFSYSWSGTSITPTNAAVAAVNPQAAGTYVYNVTVTDAAGCTGTATRTITVTSNPIANAGSAQSVCSGSNATLGGLFTGSGGTGPYTFSWSHGATTSNPVVAPTSTTIYCVTVTDANSCTATSCVTVTVKPLPTADAGPNVSLSSCSPSGVTIGGSPTASGGNGPTFTYSWSPSGGLSSTTVSNPVVQGITVTTTYAVTVTDAGGCTASDQVVVTVVNNSPIVGIAPGGPTQWCAASGGSTTLTASVAAGTAPFTYSWSGSSINPTNTPTVTVNPNTSGTFTYTVVVTDAANCTGSASTTIVVNPNPTASAGPNDTICNGICVAIGGSPSASGGTAPYSYAWSSGSAGSNPTVCPLFSTTYVLTVTDARGCTATSATTVIVNPLPVANAGFDQTLINCNGDSVIIGGSPTGFGGSGSFTYSWSPSTGLNNTTVANPVVRGITSTTTYCVTVTDASSGCTASDCVTITTTPSSLQAFAAPSVSYCAGAVPSVNVGGTPTASGGTPPYTYSWTGAGLSATNVPNPTAQPASTTTYCVIVTDANGCSASSCMTITVTPLPLVNAGTDTAVCFGSCVVIGGNPSTGSGGTGTLTYTWTPGTGLNSSSISNPTACPGVSTSYSVTVTDSRGCSATDDVSIVVNPIPFADAGFDAVLTTCAGDSVQLGGTPASGGGTGALTCSWIPTTGLNNPNSCNPWFSGSTAGTFFYTLTVTDALGCSATDQVSVRVNNGSLQIDAGNDVEACAGSVGNVTLGGIDEVLGGEGPFTFAWASTPPGFTSSAAHPLVSPTVTTTYCLTVTDNNGCSSTDCMTITVHPVPVANAGNDTTVCDLSAVVLGGNPTASGGTPNYTFNWGPGFGLNSTTFPNPTAVATSTTTYCVTVTDAEGCSATDCMTITVRQNPVADAGPDQSMPACTNACVQIGGSPTASAGGGIYNYSWSPPNNPPLSDSSIANPFVCNLGSTSTFTVVVTDQFGCSASDQVTVFTTNPTLTANAGNDVSFCAGSNVCATIGGIPTGVGGCLPYTYAWSSVPPSIISQVSNPVVCPTVTTIYNLVITDACGCIATDQVTVTVNPRPTVCPMRDLVICQGESTQLGCNPTAIGGTGPITYLWSPGGGLNSISSGNPIATPLNTTTYCVTATDSLGCSASGCQTITINPPPVADAGQDQTISNCPGSFATLGGSPSGSGGSGNYSYQWTPCLAPPTLSSCTTPNPVVTGLTNTTTFTLIVTDNFTGCIDSDQVTITVIQSTLTVSAGPDRLRCGTSAACIPIGGNPTAQGGVGPYTYQWGPGVVLPVANPCVSPTVTTTYCVTVTDALGCSFIDCMTITIDPVITVNAGVDSQICTGTCLTLGGNPTASGGTPPFTYSWNNGAFPSNVANPTACPFSATTYTVTVTDSLGCTASDNVNIALRPLPIADAGTDAILVACSGDSAVLGGSPTATGTVGPYTYIWSNLLPPSNTQSNPTTGNLGSNTTYCVTVTDLFGCSASDCVDIAVVPNTLFANAGPDHSLCSANLTCVTLGAIPPATGGVPQYQYLWTGGTVTTPTSANPTACPTATTTYTLVVTDSRNCSATDQVTVTVNTTPVASISGLNSQYCVNAPNVSMTGTPSGVFSGPGVTGNVFSPAFAGIGTHTITFIACVAGCCDTVTQTVTVNPLPQVSVTGYVPSYCTYETPDTLIATPAGGVFNPPLPGNVFDPNTAGPGTHAYTYTYTDPQTGCSGSTSFSITVRPQPTVTVTPSADTVCLGGSTVLCPNYSLDVSNIRWETMAGTLFFSGLNCPTITPPLSAIDHCVRVVAISTNGCLDTSIVCIHVNQPPVANNDSAATCEEQQVVIDVLANDTDPESDSSFIACLLSTGGTQVVNNGVVTYTPGTDVTGVDTLTYCLCNIQCPTQCDTGIVVISICPINDPPVVTDVTTNTCRDSTITVCPPIADVDDAASSLTFNVIACGTVNGSVTSANSCITYIPTTGFTGTQTICVVVCDTSNTCDTATITITVDECNTPPIAVDDAQQQWCDYDTLTLNVLDNDSDPDGDVLTVTELFNLDAVTEGTATITNTTVTLIPGISSGPISFSYVVCDDGNPSLCDTANITVSVIDCITEIDLVADTICVGETSNTCPAVNSTFPYTITSICTPQNGTAVVAADPTCFTYTPAQGFSGNDTFCITICDDRGHCDDTTVIMTTLDCLIQAVDEPCDLTETPMNTPITIDVLANDIIPQGGDTTVIIECEVTNGTAVPDPVTHTITVTPNNNFEGEIRFCYRVCVVTGTNIVCDSASVCVTVEDTTCYIPNAFSPNGDGNNDLFVIPCNENNENATLRIYDRWGVEVWYSNGHYLDDFAGRNMQGTELPDGTYYLIYDYNNGSGKREAKFVVIHR